MFLGIKIPSPGLTATLSLEVAMARGSGSNSRKRANARRYEARQKRKAATRAEYADRAGTADNVKRKGNKGTGGFNPNKHMHLVSRCGNTGCGSCFPKLILPR